MKVILKLVLARYELAAPDEKPERAVRRFVTYPSNRGGRVIVRRRQESSTPSLAPV
jgi:cytochrome P450